MPQKLRTLEDVQQHYRWLQDMRARHPVWQDESDGTWHVFRYRDVNQVLAEYKLFSSERRRLVQARSFGSSNMARTLIDMDPPDHRRYRSLVSPFFTPQALARLSGRIASITQELLDRVRATGQMDLMSDLAYPLPATVIAELLGISTADLPRFKRWSDEISAMLARSGERQQSDEGGLMDGEKPSWIDEMPAYFLREIGARRHSHDGREDLISALVEANVEGEHLDEREIVSFCFVLLRAGHITTTRLLSQAIRCFDEHPDVLEYLRTHPQAMPGAIEEVLRYASPVWALPRTAKTDVNIAGVTIPEGAQVSVWLASANRDEEQFPDPERFEITRSPNRHVAFGHGIHLCVGAPLARLEASIALPMLLEQLPNLRVSREAPLELPEGPGSFEFRRLPITFTPS